MDGPILSLDEERRIARLAALLVSSKAPEPAAALASPATEALQTALRPVLTPEVKTAPTLRPSSSARSALEKKFATDLKRPADELEDEEPLLDLIVRPVTLGPRQPPKKSAELLRRVSVLPGSDPQETEEPLSLDPAYFRRLPVRGRRL